MGTFKPGHKKVGGRPKGGTNKITALAHGKAEELGIDPFEVLLLFASGDWKALGYGAAEAPSSYSEHGTVYKYTIDPSVRARCAEAACSYLLAKRKSVDLNVMDERGKQLAQQAEEFEKLPASQKIKLLEQHTKRLKGET